MTFPKYYVFSVIVSCVPLHRALIISRVLPNYVQQYPFGILESKKKISSFDNIIALL